MTIVHGQIETLKRIKEILRQNGIDRFHSIRDIEEFKKHFEAEKKEILSGVEREFDEHLNVLREEESGFREAVLRRKKEVETKFQGREEYLKKRIELLTSTEKDGFVEKLTAWLNIQYYGLRLIGSRRKLKRKLKREIGRSVVSLETMTRSLAKQTRNRDRLIKNRREPKLRMLNHTLEVVEGLSPLIAGAVGENLVVKELSQLSDDFILYNDYSVEFNPPIYNRKENDRIFSIQIDHLLVSRSGVFVIETKNWSERSIQNLDMRSPVEQVRRTGFALFVLLNHGSSSFNHHHWGDVEVPVRNLIVMIHQKPKEKFKYVQVKTLKELNGYVNHFEPVFDRAEVHRICDYLERFR